MPANRNLLKRPLKNREELLILIHIRINLINDTKIGRKVHDWRRNIQVLDAAIKAGKHRQKHSGGEANNQTIMQAVLQPVLSGMGLLTT